MSSLVNGKSTRSGVVAGPRLDGERRGPTWSKAQWLSERTKYPEARPKTNGQHRPRYAATEFGCRGHLLHPIGKNEAEDRPVAVKELIGSQDAMAKGFRTVAELTETVRADAVHGDIAEPLLRPTSKQLAMAFHQSLTSKP